MKEVEQQEEDGTVNIMKSKGLGDTIAKITKATGIKHVVETVSKATGKDCGCKKRQEKLNKIFPYKNK